MRHRFHCSVVFFQDRPEIREEDGVRPWLGRRMRREDKAEAFLGARLALFLLVERLSAERLVALAVILACETCFCRQGEGKECSAFTQGRA